MNVVVNILYIIIYHIIYIIYYNIPNRISSDCLPNDVVSRRIIDMTDVINEQVIEYIRNKTFGIQTQSDG